jgi:tetratricopeptide (TPR) repeat protein
MFQRNWKPWLFGLFLLLALPASTLAAGAMDLRQAQQARQAGDYAEASATYARTARVFFWRGDLWEQAGITASLAGDYVQAIAHLTINEPRTEEGWFRLAASHYQLGDLEAAHDATLHGDSLRLYDLQALILYEQKDWTSERVAREHQIRLGSEDAFVHYRLGLLLALSSPQDALPILTRAATLNPEVAPAVETLRAALALSSTQADESQRMVSIGRAFGLVEEWELALAAFTSAVTLDGKNAEAWAWLGLTKQQQGQEGGADLDRAVSLDSDNPTIRGLRALYWTRQGDDSRALEDYVLAAKHDAENPTWQAGIGATHQRLGDLIAALEAYQRAVELAPMDAGYWRLLAEFCVTNGVYVEEIGLPSAQQAVTLAPQDAFVLDTLGSAYAASGRYSNAEQAFLEAIEIIPDFYAAHIHLALNYLAQNERAAAFNTLTFVRDAGDAAHRENAVRLLDYYFP